MSKNKKKWNKKNPRPKSPTQSTGFKSFEECISWIKKCVYLIARGKKIQLKEKIVLISSL